MMRRELSKSVSLWDEATIKVAAWIHSEGDDQVIGHRDVIRKIEQLGIGRVTTAEYYRFMSKVRTILEREYETTLQCRNSVGYKKSTPAELAVHTLRCARLSMVWGFRARHLATFTDKQYIPDAFRSVFGKAIRGIKVAIEESMPFVTQWIADSNRPKKKRLLYQMVNNSNGTQGVEHEVGQSSK